MRTTLTIDDDVLEAAKEIAARERRTAGAVLSDLARRALSGAAWHQTQDAAAAQPNSGDFHGFVTLPADDRIVTNALIDRIREEEGI